MKQVIVGAVIAGIFTILAELIGIIPPIFFGDKLDIELFEVDRNEINPGEKVLIKWNVKDAEKVTLEIGNESHFVGDNGQRIFEPKFNTEIKLIAVNGNNIKTATSNIILKTKPEPPNENKDSPPKKNEQNYPNPEAEQHPPKLEVPSSTIVSSKYILSGKVFDESKNVISDAFISFDKTKTNTNQNGYFKLEVLTNKEGIMSVSKSGFDTFRGYIIPPDKDIVITLNRKK